MASSVPAVTPSVGLTTQVATALQSVAVSGGNINGGYIVNPASNVDQGLATAEPLYVDTVGLCQPAGGVLYANGTIVALQPGQTFALIPGTTQPTYVNATTGGHKFTVVIY